MPCNADNTRGSKTTSEVRPRGTPLVGYPSGRQGWLRDAAVYGFIKASVLLSQSYVFVPTTLEFPRAHGATRREQPRGRDTESTPFNPAASNQQPSCHRFAIDADGKPNRKGKISPDTPATAPTLPRDIRMHRQHRQHRPSVVAGRRKYELSQKETVSNGGEARNSTGTLFRCAWHLQVVSNVVSSFFDFRNLVGCNFRPIHTKM